MKIAIVSLTYLPISEQSMGGLEVVVYELVKQLLKMGHKVTLFGLSNNKLPVDVKGIVSSENLREDNLPLDNKYFVRRYTTYQALALLEALKSKDNFHVIHVHLPEWQYGFLYSSGENIVVTAHGNYMTSRLTEIILKTKPGPKLACVSKFIADNCFPSYQYKHVVYNGIDLSDYKPNYQGEDYLVWLGRITPIKDPKTAIEIAQATNKRLIIAGGIDYNDFFVSQVKPYLNDKIKYIGPIFGKEKNELLSLAKALILTPTSEEAFGLVAAEAMASGTPVITFNKGALSEVVVDGKTGYIVNNKKEMIDKVNQIDKISRRECRQWVEERFSAEKMAQEYLNIYSK